MQDARVHVVCVHACCALATVRVPAPARSLVPPAPLCSLFYSGRHLPLARDLVRVARQRLVFRLDSYCKRDNKLFSDVIKCVGEAAGHCCWDGACERGCTAAKGAASCLRSRSLQLCHPPTTALAPSLFLAG